MITSVMGPECAAAYDPYGTGRCNHPSCHEITLTMDYALFDGVGFCETHGYQRIVKEGRNYGFCAGYVYWADLACGHQLVQDNSYLEA